jgi:hypothetical protein
VLDKNGIFVPVKHYKCVINTRDSPPIAIKKILYGPKETPIMRKAIAALEKVGQIHQITDNCWLFKALLASKPHQEHVQIINDFVWPFCINYIPLNSATRIIAYPIPRCNSAINEEFGLGVLYWLFDAPMGYHQLAVALASQEKLAFQGPDAIKWTYRVMPFGPTNGPTTFKTSYTMLTANGKRLQRNQDLSLTATLILRSLSRTFPPGLKQSTIHCFTLNANFAYVNPTNCCSACVRVISFPNALSLLRLTFVWTVTALPCQSTTS